MGKGKRYDEPKLNLKKVFGTIITLALVMVGIGLLIKPIIPQKQH